MDKNRLATQDELVIKLYEQGLNGTVIAERLQANRAAVSDIIKRLKAEGRLRDISHQ